MSTRPLADVVVVGGGISGLAAAHRISIEAPTLRVVIVERTDKCGGKIQTVQKGDYLCEEGADSFLASKPEGIALCEQLGITDLLISPDSNHRSAYIKLRDNLYPIPDGLSGLVPGKLTPVMRSSLLSHRGRARFALEQFVARSSRTDDESVGAFIRRRFGAEAYQHLFEPLLGGIYGGDANRMSLLATFPHLRRYESDYGSVLKGHRKGQSKRSAKTSTQSGFVSFSSGMSVLVTSLLKSMPSCEIRTNCEVIEINNTSGYYSLRMRNNEQLTASAVVLAIPANGAARMLQTVSPPASNTLSTFRSSSAATVTAAFREGDFTDIVKGRGYLVPKDEYFRNSNSSARTNVENVKGASPIIACTYSSRKYANRAPAGVLLVRMYFGRDGFDSVVSESDDTLLRVAEREFGSTNGVKVPAIFSHVSRWIDALPQYAVGHNDLVSSVRTQLSHISQSKIAVAGASYDGVGIPDCIRSGWNAADLVLTSLSEAKTPCQAS